MEKEMRMNQTISDIMTRRSVRTFDKKPVPRQELETILKAGFAAPSANGTRPFRVAVFEDLEPREKMASVMPWFKPIVEAPAALLVLADPAVNVNKGYWMVDCAAFTENVLVAARALSLGTVWCGIVPVEENIANIRSVLDIPEPLVPFCAIAVGYPSGEGAFKERPFDDEARTFWNPKWIKGTNR